MLTPLVAALNVAGNVPVMLRKFEVSEEPLMVALILVIALPAVDTFEF